MFIFQCLHLMYAEVARVLVSLGTQVQPHIILDPDYLPDYLSVSYDYDFTEFKFSYSLQDVDKFLILPTSPI